MQIRQQNLIALDNRLLMDRLAVAMTIKNIDNELHKKPFVSLMELQRKKQLTSIMMDNARLLDRIQKTVPTYDTTEWKMEEEAHVAILRNMTEFPELFQAPGERKSLLNPTRPDYGKEKFKEPTPEERALLEKERRRRAIAATQRQKKRVERIRSGPPSLNASRNNSRPTSGGNGAEFGGGGFNSPGVAGGVMHHPHQYSGRRSHGGMGSGAPSPALAYGSSSMFSELPHPGGHQQRSVKPGSGGSAFGGLSSEDGGAPGRNNGNYDGPYGTTGGSRGGSGSYGGGGVAGGHSYSPGRGLAPGDSLPSIR